MVSEVCQYVQQHYASLFLHTQWRRVTLLHDNFALHFVSLRGEASKGESPFRDSFAKLGELRSITKEGGLNVPLSVLSLLEMSLNSL